MTVKELQAIKKTRKLTAEEQAELRARIGELVDQVRAAYPRLLPYLLAIHQRLVKAAMRRGYDADEIEHQGWIGVVNAANKYDAEKTNGGTFVNYALWHVRGHVTKLVARIDRGTMLSLSEVIGDGGERFSDNHGRPDPPPPDDAWWDRALVRLSARNAEIIRLRYRDGLTMAETGERMGMSRQGVRYLEQYSIGELRQFQWWFVFQGDLQGADRADHQ